ncbi:MAG: hemerythrin domain-containing protein [Rhodospirillaceae bacterium]|nr:hemerythrin domain-containing protein [Rhodospirillaceae bacterium]
MYALSEAMLTGVPQLDGEHQDLVLCINRLEDAERNGDLAEVLRLLAIFKSGLAEHFAREEAYLGLISFPRLDAHAKHHSETIVALERMVEELQAGASILGEIAAQCFNELLQAVLLMDMQVINWRADRQLAGA